MSRRRPLMHADIIDDASPAKQLVNDDDDDGDAQDGDYLDRDVH